MKEKGILYVVGTPIGNLEDISIRALRVLKEVDAIICEDTKKSVIILEKYGIKKPLYSYYKPKEKEKSDKILSLLEEGKNLALITDAGTPLISDPGAIIVSKAHERGIKVVSIPGPSSVTSALSVSGFIGDRFIFEGFLPKKRGEREKRLLQIKNLPHTIVFFVPGRDLGENLEQILKYFGNRKVCIARELTKYFEELRIGYIEEILPNLGELKGEVTLIVEGAKDDNLKGTLDVNFIKDFVREKLRAGYSFKDLLRFEELKNVRRNQLYKIWQEVKNG
ncbi:MAG: 16S rRNA (cytidine(1402)-2'-O)-methyltransferase [Proteobacteria bacterium]|nr:16S rRNA (cytidine(1402)-2'-O)-methyltransferase [Pseudomonadota bacterium]